MDYTPYNYQKKITNFILGHERCNLFVGTGLGKTAATLDAITTLKEWDGLGKVLVVAPLHIANNVWRQETEKWAGFNHLTVSIATGTKKQKQEAFGADADIYVTNRETLAQWDEYTWPVIEMIVVDECTSIKNHTSKRSKALEKMLKLFSVTKRGAVPLRYVGLTGSVGMRDYEDIYGMMAVVHNPWSTKTRFLNTYFRPLYGKGHVVYKWGLLAGGKENLLRDIAPYCLSLSVEDYLDAPDMIEKEYRVDLSPKVMKAIKKLERDYIVEIDDETVTASNAGVLCQKLIQCALGLVYTDPDQTYDMEPTVGLRPTEYFTVHTEKITAVKDLVNDMPDNCLLFANYIHERKEYLKVINDAEEFSGKEEQIERWNKGEIKCLILNPKSAGYGLNLQYGGHVAVWASPTYDYEAFAQANARLHRTGQTEPVSVIKVIATGTFDEVVYANQDEKKAIHEFIMGYFADESR